MRTHLLVSAATAILLAGVAGATAASSVTATTDLNVRAGPGPHHPVVGMIGRGQPATLDGCIKGSKWCSVNGGKGWAYSEYLVGDVGGRRVVITERPADFDIEYIPAPESDVVVSNEVTGAIVGGELGEAIEPPTEIRSYVVDNRTDTIYLDGEVAVGAMLPEDVEFREIPDYRYRYVYVNSQPVLVEPETRRIVYVVR
ncbi:DUF1236 domain-containing protein [Mesorhizobium sp. 1B3]|uniref:DUF1236 domain-containing protein n=1 Tax=Mesorhizobium sp. 1B3 TaxID=3243599 RepID=UPI003D97B53B